MPTTKITDATVEPVTLAEAKVALRIDDAAWDAQLQGFITAARTELENLLLRTLITTTWELVVDGFPTCHPALQLHWPRVQSITNVRFIDADGVQQTLDPQDYALDNASEPAWLVPAYGRAWPTARGEVNALRVRYVAGYGATAADVPAPLKTWILLRVSQLYQGCAEEHAEAMSRSLLLGSYRVYDV